MAFVQLVLGPSLTFIVFDHLKQRKVIIFDLSIIALVQAAALIWGGYQVYTQRPIALVFWYDAFYTVTSDDYSMQGIENPDFSQFSAACATVNLFSTTDNIDRTGTVQSINGKNDSGLCPCFII